MTRDKLRAELTEAIRQSALARSGHVSYSEAMLHQAAQRDADAVLDVVWPELEGETQRAGAAEAAIERVREYVAELRSGTTVGVIRAATADHIEAVLNGLRESPAKEDEGSSRSSGGGAP